MDPTPAPSTTPPRRKRWPWVVGGIVVAVVLVAVVAPFVYINVIREDAPPPLSLGTPTGSAPRASTGGASGSPSGGGGDVDGSWTVGEGSQAGYRVPEILFGQSTEAVGRTSEVEGAMTISGTTASGVEVKVDMASVTSDQGQRDGQFRGRIMETSKFPEATFTVTQPVDFGAVPPDGTTVTVPVTGELTLKGTTKPVTVDLQAQRDGDTIKVQGSIPVTFADYGIANPSGGPAQTGDEGTIEFLIAFQRA